MFINVKPENKNIEIEKLSIKAPNVVKISKALYFDIYEVIRSIGGSFTTFHGILFILSSMFIIYDWEKSLIMAAQNNERKTLTTTEHTSLLKKIRNRVSFKGIYDIFDTLQFENNELESQVASLRDTLSKEKRLH